MADELRELAAFTADEGVVVSLFVGGARGVGHANVEGRLDSLLARARREAHAAGACPDRESELALAADLERAAEHVRSHASTASIACFADSADGLWRSTAVDAPLADAVRVGPSPYLVPLAAARFPHELVAAVSRERGEIYRLESGLLTQLTDLSQEQPRRHRDAQAWQQRRLERRVDDLARRHLHRVAGELDRLVRESSGSVLVLAGEDEHTAAVTELLSRDGRAALAGTVRAEAHEGPAGLVPLVLPVFEQQARDAERAAVESWHADVARGRAVQGWDDTLAAASDGRVDRLLFVQERTADARRCPVCGRVWTAETMCPRDGSPLETDALDLAVRLTLRHGGDVRRLGLEAGFDALQGIGVLLRF